MQTTNDDLEQTRILEYWFGTEELDRGAIEAKQKVWYAGGEAIDNDICDHFGEIFEEARNETILHWADSSRGALALVILLDQFSRNLFRGTAQAFAQDPLARAVAKRAIRHGLDQELSVPARIFLLHPFHHSEALVDQDFGFIRLKELVAEGHDEWQDMLQSSIDWFRGHRDIIVRFNRFPHRNAVLNRKSTAEEEKFLRESSSFGQ